VANGVAEKLSALSIDLVDVRGAGDAVIACIACAAAEGIHLSESSRLGMVAGAINCEHLGVHQVDIESLIQRYQSCR